MREHHPAIPTCTEHRALCRFVRNDTHGPISDSAQVVGHGPHSERQIRACVPVWNGEHVDAIQLSALALGMVARSEKRPPQPRPIKVPYLHRGNLPKPAGRGT